MQIQQFVQNRNSENRWKYLLAGSLKIEKYFGAEMEPCLYSFTVYNIFKRTQRKS